MFLNPFKAVVSEIGGSVIYGRYSPAKMTVFNADIKRKVNENRPTDSENNCETINNSKR